MFLTPASSRHRSVIGVRRGHPLARARSLAALADAEWVLTGPAGGPGDPAALLAEMAANTETRQATQPVNTRTGGSTFKNPPGAKAWELVDKAGWRGLMLGGAQVSPLHCNFLVAHAGATAADVEALGEEVRRRVLESAGVALEWEIKRVGLARPADREAGR